MKSSEMDTMGSDQAFYHHTLMNDFFGDLHEFRTREEERVAQVMKTIQEYVAKDIREFRQISVMDYHLLHQIAHVTFELNFAYHTPPYYLLPKEESYYIAPVIRIKGALHYRSSDQVLLYYISIFEDKERYDLLSPQSVIDNRLVPRVTDAAVKLSSLPSLISHFASKSNYDGDCETRDLFPSPQLLLLIVDKIVHKGYLPIPGRSQIPHDIDDVIKKHPLYFIAHNQVSLKYGPLALC